MAVRMWLRLDLRRRWRSLTVLALLVALAAGATMAATAGARRGASALDRLARPTLPATIAVLANTPGFDWDKVRAMPQVESLTTFVVDYTWAIQGLPGDVLGFPIADDAAMRTIEKPIVYSGRVFDPTRADEVVVSRQFVKHYHKHVGDTVVIELPTPKELSTVEPGPNGLVLHGPRITARIVGVVASPWFTDQPGSMGFVQPSPGLTARYPASIIGDQSDQENVSYINALVRLKGGEAAIPAFREAFDDLTHRSDIDIWSLPALQRDIQRHIVFESRCLLAFAAAVFIAALFLIGQAIVRYAADSAQEMQTLRALGMTRRQAVAWAATGPTLVGIAGGLAGAAMALIASRWFPIDTAASYEPYPGIRPDWPVLTIGVVLVVALVMAGAAGAARLALGTSRSGASPRPSAIATLASRAGFGAPVVVGTRFALESGRGKTAVPVRPALLGAVIGVLGVIGVFTFSHGVTDAATHPERFGQTFQLGAFIGINGQDFAPVRPVFDAIAKDGDVAGVDDARTAIATGPGGGASISLWEYGPGTKPLPVVITSGRMATTSSEVVLAPRTLAALHKSVGDQVQLTGSRSGSKTFTITGSGLVPQGPHNGYADGGWITTDGFDSIFNGYKYRIELVAVRPGLNTGAVSASLATAVHKAVPAAEGLTFDKPDPLTELAVLRQVQSMPIVLGCFLALLAIGAVGHALATAVRRRSLDIAVLRALGMTRWQSRGIVVTQASTLAIVGLVFGIPLGLALGRMLWRVVADYTPVQYAPPMALLALMLIGPAALLLANLLAAWPGHQAARLRIGHVLRTE
jgi:ABC-type lipoprotein release transport system permease subunit